MAEYESHSVRRTGNGDDDDQPRKALFTNQDDDQPIKFYMQKDFPDSLKKSLTKDITTNGGVVITQIPLSGYVLVNPASETGEALTNKWTSADRPERHVVPYTFVTLSVFKRKIVDKGRVENTKMVFTNDEEPVAIFFDPSVGESRISALTPKVLLSKEHGGIIAKNASSADVIIADDSKPGFRALVSKHSGHERYVEPLAWVKQSIKENQCSHDTLPEFKQKALGRRPGTVPQPFTPEDDKHLVEYLARKTSTGRGRAGNKVYQELCQDFERYPWAVNHPWDSWRNKYCKNREQFDSAISKWFNKHPHLQSEPITQSKKTKPKPKPKPTARVTIPTDSDGDGHSSSSDLEYDVADRPRRRKRAAKDTGGSSRNAQKRRRVSDESESDEDLDAEQMMRKMMGPPTSRGEAATTARKGGSSPSRPESVPGRLSKASKDSGVRVHRRSRPSDGVEAVGNVSDDIQQVNSSTSVEVVIERPPPRAQVKTQPLSQVKPIFPPSVVAAAHKAKPRSRTQRISPSRSADDEATERRLRATQKPRAPSPPKEAEDEDESEDEDEDDSANEMDDLVDTLHVGKETQQYVDKHDVATGYARRRRAP
ncbi:hypothetical protein FRB99_008080 [Tulasnella sp. 403]|nr:hypothetical protein FRB99_008080 [Tulasnella sp. 403]